MDCLQTISCELTDAVYLKLSNYDDDSVEEELKNLPKGDSTWGKMLLSDAEVHNRCEIKSIN